MASLCENKKTGLREIQFFDANGKRQRIRLGRMLANRCETITGHIEELNAARIANADINRETAKWVRKLDDVLHGKLAKVGLVAPREPAAVESITLAAFLDSYIESRSKIKASTKEQMKRIRRELVRYFGADRALATITIADAKDFREYLSTTRKLNNQPKPLASNSVRRICGRAKQFFLYATDKKLIPESPFAKMQDTNVRANEARDFQVTAEMAARVLDACPDAQWRLLFTLSRYGGLRCPSEHLLLRWGDVDWERGRLTVWSPKTEHHEGKGSRVIPLFPEVRQSLTEVFDQAEPGTEFLITRYRDKNSNLRTQLERIIRKAGLEPWPKLFQNLRRTRQTELADRFPQHVVCAWMGNTAAVAAEHYFRVTPEHFEQAQNAGQNLGQQTQESPSKVRQPILTSLGITEDFSPLPTCTDVQSYPARTRTTTENAGENANLSQGGAKWGAFEPDSDLATIIAAWPKLSKAIKRKILALAQPKQRRKR